MYNRAILIGNVGKDVELRTLQNGGKVASFSLATSERWTKDGERQEKTTWHNVVIFNEKLAEIADKYVRKGSRIHIEGQIATRSYDKNGETRYVTEIVLPRFGGMLTLLDTKSESRGGGGGETEPDRARQGPADMDDEIPF